MLIPGHFSSAPTCNTHGHCCKLFAEQSTHSIGLAYVIIFSLGVL